MEIEVRYKQEGEYKSGYFKCWSEEGSYTLFYNDISLDSLAFIVPTKNICWIKVTRE